MSLSAGEMLNDNLMLERELGRGGMGSVWLAKNQSLGNHVAVKILHKDIVVDELQRQRFEQEARGLAQLDHPHIVKLFDFGLTLDGEPYIVMEVLRGEDLSTRITRIGPLDLRSTSTIVSQACKALARAHGAGIVHRDIKPANIFLLEHDGEVFVKVLDFGIAKFSDGPNSSRTATGVLLGTPNYMSPEQLMNARSVDARTDVWAMGVVTYAALTGKMPFIGDTIADLTLSIVNQAPLPIRQHRPELPAALDAWQARALHKDPSQRFQTIKELGDALTAIAHAAQSPSHVARNSVAVPQAPIQPVAAPTASAPIAASAPVAAPIVSAPAPPAGVFPAPPAGPANRLPLVVGIVGLLALLAGVIGAVIFVRRGSTSTTDDTSRSDSAPSSNAPLDFSKLDDRAFYERALQEAKKVDSGVELWAINIKSVNKDGKLEDNGAYKASFHVPNTKTCVDVALTKSGAETTSKACGARETVPVPRCTVAKLRARSKDTRNANFTYMSMAPENVPKWVCSVPDIAFSKDDCE